ncbi:MAG: VOC family protein [Bradymonadia bacterium]
MKMDKYTHGTFSWIDLAALDLDGAKAFYSELFGWSAQDVPAPNGSTYTMFLKDGDTVAAAYSLPEEMRAPGVPAFWCNYVSVDEIGPVLARAEAAGGQVKMPACEIGSSGQMAALTDPSGAPVFLWQPGEHIGATRVNEPGCLTWNELATRDVPGSLEFYNKVFGWTAEVEEGPMAYTTVKNGERANGGVISIDPSWGEVPPHWVPYICVENCEESVARAEAMGAKIVVPTMEAEGVGFFAQILDPQGAHFALMQMHPGAADE